MINNDVDFSKYNFFPVIDLSEGYEVFDFTKSYDPHRALKCRFGIGRYNEKRPDMYQGELYQTRNIHMGIDIGAPIGTSVRGFYEGMIFSLGDNDRPFDYGPTIITSHQLQNKTLYALHGHLSRDSLKKWNAGDQFEAGEQLGSVGSLQENGGWNPHLHFQLSWLRPDGYDLPGVVAEKDHAWALNVFPDPRLVLGQLYPSQG